MTAEVAIGAYDVRRRFGAVAAVRGLSLEVARGELYGLVGPDGAGKSTTIAMLAGLMTPDEGHVAILGSDPAARGSVVREDLGLMLQDYSLYGDLSVAENLRFFGQLFVLPRRVYDERAARLLAITRLAPFVDRPARALSGGMYKKLALACALIHQPKVLLLDEPTNGVDPVSRRELWDLIYDLVDEGMAVLVSTPYMDEAARCHRVGLMSNGRRILEGAPSDLIASIRHDVREIVGGDRERIHELLDATPGIVAASPAGARLRVVVDPSATANLERAVASLGASSKVVPPDFEDLFLTAMASEEAA